MPNSFMGDVAPAAWRCRGDPPGRTYARRQRVARQAEKGGGEGDRRAGESGGGSRHGGKGQRAMAVR
jgi:hypothetical protein